MLRANRLGRLPYIMVGHRVIQREGVAQSARKLGPTRASTRASRRTDFCDFQLLISRLVTLISRVIFSRISQMRMATEMPVGDVGNCLGYWWKGDLLATRSVDENIKKARRAFFHYGSIAGRYLPPPQNQCWSAVSSLSYSTDARTGF